MTAVGNGICRISGRTSPASAVRRARETAGALACLVQAEGLRGSPPARAFIVAGRLMPQEALGAEAAFGARKSMRSRLGRTPGSLPVSAWHGRRQAGAGLVADKCKDIPPDASAPAVRTVADTVAPAPSHPARPGASSGARIERAARITYMAKIAKAQMGMRYRPRLPSSSPLPEREGSGWVRLRRT